MNLKELDLTSFIPEFMKDDEDTKAFIYAIQQQLKPLIDNIRYASIYSRVAELDDTILDMLADQFSISEYNKSYSIDVKRSLIKNCMLIHHQRGTVSAVEKVVNDVFGNARVTEWFDYDGQPYYFRVSTTNASASDEMLAEFDRIIKVTQNCRSYLESATVELYNTMDVKVGAVCAISTVDTFKCRR